MRTWFAKILSRVSLPRDIVLTLLAIGISWAITHIYYRQSISDLKADIAERIRVEDLLLRGIESVGTIKYQRDITGKVIGVKIDLRGAVTATSTVSGSLLTEGVSGTK